MNSILSLLIGMVIITIIYSVVHYKYLSVLFNIEKKWMTAIATITTLKIRPLTRSKLFYESWEDYKLRLENNTYLDLTYEYRVNGRLYRNTRIDPAPRDGEGPESLNKERFDVLSAQDTLDILYNPKDPSQSYMKQDFSFYRNLRLLVTGIYGCAMLLCLGAIVLYATGIF